MRNTEIFSRINSENEETYTKDGIEETNIVTNETVVLVGRVKTVKTAETKNNKPMATLIMSGGARQFLIKEDGSIDTIEPERDDEGRIKSVFVDFYNSNQPRGNKAYDDLMKLATPKSEDKQAAVRRGSIVLIKATKQIKTRVSDGSQFVTYMGTKVYISGIAEVQNKIVDNVVKPGSWTLLNSVILREKDGQYSLTMPVNMLNPITNNYDITCFLECNPISGEFTPEMIQSFGKREKAARVALLAKPEDYVVDLTNPLKPTGYVNFSAWATIPEFEDNEISDNRGNVVTVE